MNSVKLPAIVTMLIVLFVALALSGCTSPTPTPTTAPTPTAAPTATPAPVAAALTISGNVSTPLSLSVADLRTYAQNTINESTTNSANVTTTVSGTGPSLNALLVKAGPSASATNITFKAADYSKTIALSKVTGSPNATVIILADGSLRDIIPGQGSGAWVGNLTTIVIS